MSDEMFKIVPIVGPPQRAAWAEPKEPTAPEPPAESAAPGPPAEPIFEEGRVGIVRNTKRFVTAILTSAVWLFGAVFMLVLLFSGTPYEFREDRGNGHWVARGTSTGSLFSPPENGDPYTLRSVDPDTQQYVYRTFYRAHSEYAIPHLLAGQFILELGVLVGIAGGALWILGWRPRRGDHI